MTTDSGSLSFPNNIFDRDLLKVIVGGILWRKGSRSFGLFSAPFNSTASLAETQPCRLTGSVMRNQSEFFASDIIIAPSFIIETTVAFNLSSLDSLKSEQHFHELISAE